MDEEKNQIKETVTTVSISFDPKPAMQFAQYIKEKVVYPTGETAEGQLVVGFKTNDSGAMTDIQIIQSLSEATDIEALRVVEAYGQWAPRPTAEERKTISKHTIGINFNKEQI